MPLASRDCEVFVVGGGVAGISAAVAAAREGARTIMVEKNDFPGGAAVTALHLYICGLYVNGEDMPKDLLNGGIASEICSRLEVLSPSSKVLRMGGVYVFPFKTEDIISVLRAMSEDEHLLELQYKTHALSVETEGNAISAVKIRGQGREIDIAPRVVIDCSGNGIIVQLSGAGYQLSPVQERQFGGYTFRVKGLKGHDDMLPFRVPYFLGRAVAEKKMPFHLKFTTFTPGSDADEGFCKLSIPPAWSENRDMMAEETALKVHRYLCEVLPTFEDSFIAEMSPEVLDREGPRLCGEYTLTAHDVLGAKKFPDASVKNAWPIELWDQEKGPRYRYIEPGDYYEIPLRCLKAHSISNLFCAGRCISVSREALGSTRVMGACISLGEQAGRAAARTACRDEC